MELTEDDVLEILKLFEQSKFDFLQLEHGERKITVSKGGYVPTAAGGTRAARLVIQCCQRQLLPPRRRLRPLHCPKRSPHRAASPLASSR